MKDSVQRLRQKGLQKSVEQSWKFQQGFSIMWVGILSALAFTFNLEIFVEQNIVYNYDLAMLG